MARRRGKKPEDPEKENSERWLLTYSDMITLLLLFFIVLWSMSKIDAKKYDEIAQSLQTVFSGANLGMVLTAQNTATHMDIVARGAAQVDPVKARTERRNALKVKLESHLTAMAVPIRYEVHESEEGLRLTLFSNVFFEPGESRLSDEARQILIRVGQVLHGFNNPLRFEGHADPAVQDRPKGPDSWQLGFDRAAVVLRLFQELEFDPQRMSAISFGESRPYLAAESREARAYDRRVDIVLLWNEDDFGNVEEGPSPGAAPDAPAPAAQ